MSRTKCKNDHIKNNRGNEGPNALTNKGCSGFAGDSGKWYNNSEAMEKGVRHMAEFVPKDKMSKKAQKEMNRQRRKTWEFSPVTRIADSKKRYNRKKRTHDRYGDYGTGSFFMPLRA